MYQWFDFNQLAEGQNEKTTLWTMHPKCCFFQLNYGAEDGSRTRTGVTPLDFESSASANSTTSACYLVVPADENYITTYFKYMQEEFVNFFVIISFALEVLII